MSMESRLARGDDPAHVAELYGITVEAAKALQESLKGNKKAPAKKKADKKD